VGHADVVGRQGSWQEVGSYRDREEVEGRPDLTMSVVLMEPNGPVLVVSNSEEKEDCDLAAGSKGRKILLKISRPSITSPATLSHRDLAYLTEEGGPEVRRDRLVGSSAEAVRVCGRKKSTTISFNPDVSRHHPSAATTTKLTRMHPSVVHPEDQLPADPEDRRRALLAAVEEEAPEVGPNLRVARRDSLRFYSSAAGSGHARA
jgi:hypothetical protein